MVQKLNVSLIIHGIRPCYNYVDDIIFMPSLARFISDEDYSVTEKYYSTLLYELIHWTGHEMRCDRKFGKDRICKDYAFDELVAEVVESYRPNLIRE